MLVIGSDSHTCSAGSVGALAIGLGVADVTMPLITGETWFKVPESIKIQLINAPGPGIGGKDTILYIMKELKRNTVAADRIVEFTGPGLEHLSCDARFAIANMTTVGNFSHSPRSRDIVIMCVNKYRNLAESAAYLFQIKSPTTLSIGASLTNTKEAPTTFVQILMRFMLPLTSLTSHKLSLLLRAIRSPTMSSLSARWLALCLTVALLEPVRLPRKI